MRISYLMLFLMSKHDKLRIITFIIWYKKAVPKSTAVTSLTILTVKDYNYKKYIFLIKRSVKAHISDQTDCRNFYIFNLIAFFLYNSASSV